MRQDHALAVIGILRRTTQIMVRTIQKNFGSDVSIGLLAEPDRTPTVDPSLIMALHLLWIFTYT